MPQINKESYKPYIAWFVATSFVFFQFFLQTSSSLMNESWLRDFNLNTLQVSNLSAAFFYTYVLMQIPVGLLYDRYSPKNILMIAAITLAIGCLILSITTSYPIAIIARFLMGIGSSFGYIGMLKVLINSFKPNKFALMLGIGETIAMTIVTLGVILLGYFLKHHSWRIAMIFCSFLAAILVFTIKYYMIETKSAKQQTKIKFAETLSQVCVILSNKQVILGSIYGFFIFAIINAFTSLWGVNFITNTTNFSAETAANMVSVVFIGLGIGAPLNGFLSKKYNNHTILMLICAIAIALTTSLIILIPNLQKLTWFISLFLSGVFCSGYVQCLAVVKESVGIQMQATALATSNMVIMSSAPILQILIGALLHSNILNLSTSGNYRFSLSIIPIGMIIAIITCYFIKEPKKHVEVIQIK